MVGRNDRKFEKRRLAAIVLTVSLASMLMAAGNPFTIGEQGLWRLELEDGGSLSAMDIETNGVPKSSFVRIGEGNRIRLVWKSAVADVTVTATKESPDVTDLVGEVMPHSGRTALMLHLPAKLRFSKESVKRFVYPGCGSSGLGVAFNAKWFADPLIDRPVVWQMVHRGGKGYRRLYGSDVAGVYQGNVVTNLIVTADGRAWFSPQTVQRLNGWKRTVARASARKDCDVILVDTENGPYWLFVHDCGYSFAA